MTALAPEAILFGTADGPGLWIGNPDTPPPTGENAPDGNDWTPVGYISEEGVPEVVNARDLTAIRVWRKRLPHRYSLQSQLVTVSFNLAEVNDTMAWLWWDQDPANVRIGHTDLNEWSALLQVVDQGTLIRAWFPRCLVTGTDPLTFDKGKPVDAGVVLTMLQSDLSDGTWERVAVTPDVPPEEYVPRTVTVSGVLPIALELIATTAPTGSYGAYPGITFPGTETYPGVGEPPDGTSLSYPGTTYPGTDLYPGAT